MICEHRLKLDKVEWNGRRSGKLKQQPKQAKFICIDCKSTLLFNYAAIIQPGE